MNRKAIAAILAASIFTMGSFVGPARVRAESDAVDKYLVPFIVTVITVEYEHNRQRIHQAIKKAVKDWADSVARDVRTLRDAGKCPWAGASCRR